MAVVTMLKTYDVQCDWPGCLTWVHGTVSRAGRSGHASNEARSRARKNGWRRKKMGGKWADLCPHHAKVAA